VSERGFTSKQHNTSVRVSERGFTSKQHNTSTRSVHVSMTFLHLVVAFVHILGLLHKKLNVTFFVQAIQILILIDRYIYNNTYMSMYM